MSHRILRACRLASPVLTLALIALSQTSRGEDIEPLFREFNVQMSVGSFAEAERTAKRMIEAAPTTAWQAASLNALGRALNGLQKYDEAAPHLEKALTIPLDGANSNRGWIPNNLAHNLRKRQKYAEAAKLFEQAQAEFTRMFGPKSEEVATARSNLGWLYFDQRQYDKAAAIHREVLELRRELFGAEHSLVGNSLNDVGTDQIHLKQFTESQKNLETALDILRKTQGPGTPDVAIVLGNLADLYRAQSDFARAESYARKELTIRERLFGKQSQIVTESLTEIAGDLEKQNKPEAAQALREDATKIAAALAAEVETPNNPFHVGQRVQVKAERAKVMAGATSLGFLAQGMEFEVTHISDKWCGIKINVGDVEKSGWVDCNLLTLAAVVMLPPVELRHTLVSKEGNFSIKLPKAPTLSQETISGIRHNAYSLEMPYGMFVIGYFDLPSGSDLTFDAAIVALATARSGLVESEDKVSLEDEYAGRDWLIRLPESQYCRMRLYTVKARRYQIVLEGPKDFVASKEADAFFASFQRTKP